MRTSNYFNQFAIDSNRQHPLQVAFLKALEECEKLPPSEQQTKTVIAINDCMNAVEQNIELLSIICEPITRHDNDPDVASSIDNYIFDTNGEVDSHFLSEHLKSEFIILKKN